MNLTLQYFCAYTKPLVFCHFHFDSPRNEVVGGYTGFTMSVRLQTNPMLYDNLSCVSQNLLKFYQLLTGEERRIPFFFYNFHFCRSRVIGLDMTENRIFTLCSYDNLSSVSQNVLKFYQQLTGEERRIPFIFGRNNQ